MRPLVFIHLLIIIDDYVLKYQIDLPDYIFSSLKLYCKKNIILLWNVLSLIIRISSQQGTILSQTQWSFLCSWQNFIVKCIWALRRRDRSTSCLPLELSLAFQTTLWKSLPLFPAYIKSICICIITRPIMHPSEVPVEVWAGYTNTPCSILVFQSSRNHNLMHLSTLSVHSEPTAEKNYPLFLSWIP